MQPPPSNGPGFAANIVPGTKALGGDFASHSAPRTYVQAAVGGSHTASRLVSTFLNRRSSPDSRLDGGKASSLSPKRTKARERCQSLVYLKSGVWPREQEEGTDMPDPVARGVRAGAEFQRLTKEPMGGARGPSEVPRRGQAGAVRHQPAQPRSATAPTVLPASLPP